MYLLRKTSFVLIALLVSFTSLLGNSFTSEYVEDYGVKLRWGPSTQMSADYFIIERSTDPVHFSKIGTITKEQSNEAGYFYFQDKEHILGFNYYRLTLIDSIQGPISQLMTVTEAYDLTNKLVVFPNPSEGYCTVSAYQAIDEIADILVVDAFGATVYEKKELRLRDDWSFDVDLRSVPTGVYILFVRTDKAVRLNARRIYIFRD